MHCARNGEFVEGVRALLIDKDNAPAWQQTYDSIGTQWVESHFVPLLETSPLADLLVD